MVLRLEVWEALWKGWDAIGGVGGRVEERLCGRQNSGSPKAIYILICITCYIMCQRGFKVTGGLKIASQLILK